MTEYSPSMRNTCNSLLLRFFVVLIVGAHAPFCGSWGCWAVHMPYWPCTSAFWMFDVYGKYIEYVCVCGFWRRSVAHLCTFPVFGGAQPHTCALLWFWWLLLAHIRVFAVGKRILQRCVPRHASAQWSGALSVNSQNSLKQKPQKVGFDFKVRSSR